MSEARLPVEWSYGQRGGVREIVEGGGIHLVGDASVVEVVWWDVGLQAPHIIGHSIQHHLCFGGDGPQDGVGRNEALESYGPKVW